MIVRIAYELMIQTIHAELYTESDQLPKLMADWCSCVCYCFCRFREGWGFDELRQRAEAAAHVISRRALRFNEKPSFYQADPQWVKIAVLQTTLEVKSRRFYSWALWKRLAKLPALTERSTRLSNSRELDGSVENGGVSPPGESGGRDSRSRRSSSTVSV